MAPTPLVIAHRGLHASGATENTLTAFQLAVEAGAEMVELDVRRTRDGELAVLHDPGDGGVMLCDCDLDEFERRTRLRPPLLREVLAWASGKVALDVELKEDGYAGQVAAMLAGFVAGGGELIVTSFLGDLLAQVAGLAPTLRLGLLVEVSTADVLVEVSAADVVARARSAHATTVLPEVAIVSEPLIAALAAAGLELIVWDFMAAAHAPLLADGRVKAVITDDVPGALAARAKLGRSTLEA